MKKQGERKSALEYLCYYNENWLDQNDNRGNKISRKWSGDFFYNFPGEYYIGNNKMYKNVSIHKEYTFPTYNYSDPWDYYNLVTPIIRRHLMGNYIGCCFNGIYGIEYLHQARVLNIVFTEIL
jgi:hypothetical protein